MPAPPPRISVNPDFFREIRSRQYSSSSPTSPRAAATNRDSARQPTSPVSQNIVVDRPTNKQQLQQAILSSPPANSAQSSSTSSQTTPTKILVEDRAKVDFEQPAYQHNRETDTHKKQHKTKKTVRFRDEDLVSIKLFEPVLSEDEASEEMGWNDGNNEHYSDHDNYDDEMSRSLDLGDKMSLSPTITAKTPAFIIPEYDQVDLRNDVYWRLPHPLALEVPNIPDGHENLGGKQQIRESDIQAAREARVPATIYRDIADIPSSPLEPDEEVNTASDPPRTIGQFSQAADPVSILFHTLRMVYEILASNGSRK
ncbi:hypothetical protein BX616_006474 [Lobosporangium transversale]|nr:hypothetical protein BX616_006474 [Lobosporangium transversale]